MEFASGGGEGGGLLGGSEGDGAAPSCRARSGRGVWLGIVWFGVPCLATWRDRGSKHPDTKGRKKTKYRRD